jgi:hypothetical protein
LKSDKNFFKEHEKVFVDDFTTNISRLKNNPLSKPALNTFGNRLYITLFSFEDDPRKELYTFAKKTMENEIDFKPIATHALLNLLKEYLDFVISQNKDISSIKALVELIEIYLVTIEEANADMIKMLKEQIHNVTKSKNDQEHDLIFYTFKTLLKNNEPIKLLTYKDELPVICRAPLLNILGNSIEINIEKCYKSIFTGKQNIYIKSDHFPKPIGGEVAPHPTKKNTILFKEVHFVELPQESRRYIRIAVSEAEAVTVATDTHSYTMRLKDISIGGMGVASQEQLPDLVNQNVLLSFSLLGKELTAEGTVKYINEHDGAYHYGIEFKPNAKLEENISEYVTNRQFEILKELKQYA